MWFTGNTDLRYTRGIHQTRHLIGDRTVLGGNKLAYSAFLPPGCASSTPKEHAALMVNSPLP